MNIDAKKQYYVSDKYAAEPVIPGALKTFWTE